MLLFLSIKAGTNMHHSVNLDHFGEICCSDVVIYGLESHGNVGYVPHTRKCLWKFAYIFEDNNTGGFCQAALFKYMLTFKNALYYILYCVQRHHILQNINHGQN